MEPGKIFVGGLDWNTDKDALHKHFSAFGEVTDCIVMKNPMSQKSRGFGFVTFSDPDAVSVVLAKKHTIDGRPVDAKQCNARGANTGGGGGGGKQSPGGGQRNGSGFTGRTTKIFVGGLPNDATDENLKIFFSKYGVVNHVAIMYDQEKDRPRGFGFLTFDSEDAVEDAVKDHYVDFHGKKIEVKRAEPRQGRRPNFNGEQGWGDGNNWAQNQGYGGGYSQQQSNSFGGYGNQGYDQNWQQSGGYGGQNWGGQNQQAYPQGGNYGGQNYGQGASQGYQGYQGYGGPNQGYGAGGYAAPPQGQGYGQQQTQSYAAGNQAYQGNQGYGGGNSQSYSQPNQAAYNGNQNYGGASQSYGGNSQESYGGAQQGGYQSKAPSNSGGSQSGGYHPYKR